MAAVTQRVVNYLSGVSKQPDSKKFPGQVKECINGLPDVTLGMTKRPGFEFLAKLKNSSGTDYSGTQLDNAKWFYINRDADTRYIGCIIPKSGSTNGSLHVWNADTGAVCTVTNGSAHAYLSGTSKTNYDVLTVQDSTIICNDEKTVTARAEATDFVAQSRGTILLSLLGQLEASIQSTSFEVKLGGTAIVNEKGGIQTCTYTSGASADYDDVLDGIKGQIDGKNITGMTCTKYGTSLQLDYVVSSTRTPFTLEVKGGADNERITVFQDWASNESWLPPNSFHNHVVTIVNSPLYDEDNYYAKFVADNGAAGSGYWKEGIGHNQSPGLTKSTMPHRLRNTGTNAFVLEEIPWGDRLVGDSLTNAHPSFVGKTIKRTFFHDDRLGFLSEDNVILSRAKEPYELYAVSARTHTPGDPIDVNCASVRPTKLHAIKPARQGLILFSKNQQFLIYADDGPLTPQTTKIRPISNMEMSDDIDPIDVGTHMNFLSKTPNFVRVFAMQTKGLGESPSILDIGRVVNEWITIDVDTFIASIQNEFIAMSSQSSDEIYFYRTYSDGEEKLMESWFKWKLAGTVQAMAVDQDDMYCVTKQGNQYTISKSNLTQSPEVAIITNAQGQKINPCMDLYAQATNGLSGGSERKVVWDATNTRSKCYIPFANLTDKKNLVIVSGTTAAGTFNNSGYVVEAEVGTDSDGTFFIVPEQNLSTIASNVYVGYAYDFDLHLPQLYVDLGEKGVQPDFTANLTVSRCKFDVGLSGIMGFKLNATGRFAASKTYTMFKNNCKDNSGNDVYTDYEWSKPDLDYIDRNQIKVKINNKSTTDFSFQSDTKIRLGNSLLKQTTLNGDGTTKLFAYTFDIESTANIKVKVGGVLTTDFVFAGGKYISFNTAPPAATGNIFIYNEDELEIYIDEWYFLEPISNANMYLADDVPLDESRTVTIPIHQRNNNYNLRVFTDSPFPVSLNSMMWEGNYSPRFYKRT
tara:strand:+ start:537 stop:3458 length:2922 start_codon:yes stop_codon:yes gene_type:complete